MHHQLALKKSGRDKRFQPTHGTNISLVKSTTGRPPYRDADVYWSVTFWMLLYTVYRSLYEKMTSNCICSGRLLSRIVSYIIFSNTSPPFPIIQLTAWMHRRALTLTHRHKPLLSVHCGAKLTLQIAPSDPWTNTHTPWSIPVYPLWFSATRGIWWNSAQVCMLSRGLQHSSPHREPRTSQILHGITHSSSLFPPLSALSRDLSPWIPLFLYLHLPLHHLLSLSTSSYFFSSFLTYIFNTRPLSSLCFSASTTLRNPPERWEKQGAEKRRKKNWERVEVYWREIT